MKSDISRKPTKAQNVAPARERGLKFLNEVINYVKQSRSREGAWIEICTQRIAQSLALCRSREGAWIEIEDIFKLGFVTISRSREGAWIEMLAMQDDLVNMQSLPRGSVD